MAEQRDAKPTFSLVTVTYNSEESLRRYGKLLVREDTEWLVIDNNSGDSSASVAADLGATVVVLPKNIGFGSATNLGLNRARGKYVGIVNPDVSADLEALPRIAEILSEDDILLSPQLLNDDDSPQPNGRGAPTLVNKVINRLSPGSARRRAYQLFARPGETLEVVWLTGAAIFARSDTWASLGGFDERFFVYYEDVDLCIRAGRQGVPSVVNGDIRWVHGWAREARGLNIGAWKLELSSAAKFYRRYPHLILSDREFRKTNAGRAPHDQ